MPLVLANAVSWQFFSTIRKPDCKTLSHLIIMYLKCCKSCHPNYALSRNICSQDVNRIYSFSLLLRLVVFNLKFSLFCEEFSLCDVVFHNRSKLQRNENRDISEVIALGVPNPRTSNEVQYDQRLFNQSKVLSV